VANSRDKASTIAGTWSHGDPSEGEPAAETDALLIPADDDPLENLFRADQTLRAPSIPAAPSEAEVTRWRATVRTSMFEENVRDPVPSAAEPPAPPVPDLDLAVDPARARARTAGPILRGVAGPVRPPPAARRVELLQPSSLAPPPTGRAPATPPPPPPAAARERSKASARSGVRSKTEPVQPEAPAPQALDLTQREPPPAPARRRRLQRGPRPALLAVLAVAALLVVGTVAVLIGLVDNPLAPRPQRVVAMLAKPGAKRPGPAPIAKPVPEQAAAKRSSAQAELGAQPRSAQEAAAAATAVPSAQAAAAEPAVPSAQAAAAEPAVPIMQAAAAEPAVPSAQSAAAEPAVLAAQPAAAEAPPAPAVAAKPVAAKVAPEQAKPAAGAAALLTSARKFLADDEPARAEAAMRELLAQDPQDHHAMELLVRALMDQDRGAEAVPFARKMVSRRGKRVAYRLLYGDVLLMAGDEGGARAEWQAALELAPEDREIKRRLGL
jgi:predicted negative regulator of RcsB-dependent stress response